MGLKGRGRKMRGPRAQPGSQTVAPLPTDWVTFGINATSLGLGFSICWMKGWVPSSRADQVVAYRSLI